jgi:anti-sigma B factor antagonist
MRSKAAVRHSGNRAIVDLAGCITLGEGSGLIRNTIKDLLDAGHMNIPLNLQEVAYIDSSGLGEMVGAYATVSNWRKDCICEGRLAGLASGDDSKHTLPLLWR